MFDPFDEKNREPNKRRKKSEVEFERREWTGRIDRAFKEAIEGLGDPEYIQSNYLLQDACPHHSSYDVLKANINKSMERLGYVKMLNQDTKDGRWKVDGDIFNIYKKESLPDVGRRFLVAYFDW